MTSLIAVALGSVKPEHWFKLGRQMAPVLGGTLVSWSGTMFEYLMPVLFTGAVPDTLLYNSCLNACKGAETAALWRRMGYIRIRLLCI